MSDFKTRLVGKYERLQNAEEHIREAGHDRWLGASHRTGHNSRTRTQTPRKFRGPLKIAKLFLGTLWVAVFPRELSQNEFRLPFAIDSDKEGQGQGGQK